jgi:lysozyme family protein
MRGMSDTFAELKPDYERLWATMAVRPERADIVDRIARELLRHKAQYLTVEAKTRVPWFVIAALHNRESDADFTTYLGNGEPLNRVTHLVPKGRGPFGSWEVGAIDALAIDGLDQVREWTPARACFEVEKFNGFGYRRRGIPSLVILEPLQPREVYRGWRVQR